MAKFEIFKGLSDTRSRPLWYWHLVGDNGEIVCESEGYSTKQHATTAAEQFPKIAAGARIVHVNAGLEDEE